MLTMSKTDQNYQKSTTFVHVIWRPDHCNLYDGYVTKKVEERCLNISHFNTPSASQAPSFVNNMFTHTQSKIIGKKIRFRFGTWDIRMRCSLRSEAPHLTL